jgi:hypothetical protein
MAGRNTFVKQFKQFNGSPPAHTRGRPNDRERWVKLYAAVVTANCVIFDLREIRAHITPCAIWARCRHPRSRR